RRSHLFSCPPHPIVHDLPTSSGWLHLTRPEVAVFNPAGDSSATEVIREAVCEAQKEADKLLKRATNQADINTANRVIKNLEIALGRLRELPKN
ncbi:MAG: hypothetical protein Q8J74_10480, partial [Candidatus Didemnitutus sp.]|nr:hypothetical protein [Candidatus Didemnitutus sp.]